MLAGTIFPLSMDEAYPVVAHAPPAKVVHQSPLGCQEAHTNLMSMGGPLTDEWRPHTDVVQQIWTQFW